MDAVELLRQHLRAVERELNQDAAEAGVDFIEMGNLLDELRLYLQVEEECVYPNLREYTDIQAELRSCIEEHEQIHRILDKIERDNRRVLLQDLGTLRNLIATHLDGRENRLLKVLQVRLTPEQSNTLAEKIERFKLERIPRMANHYGD